MQVGRHKSLKELYIAAREAHLASAGLRLSSGLQFCAFGMTIMEGLEGLAYLDRRPTTTFRVCFRGMSLDALLCNCFGEKICSGPGEDLFKHTFENDPGRVRCHVFELAVEYLAVLCVHFNDIGEYECEFDDPNSNSTRIIRVVPWAPASHKRAVIVKLYCSGFGGERGLN